MRALASERRRVPLRSIDAIEVRIGASAYVVRRRYKDFDKLHSDLCSTYGKSAVPELPPKQFFAHRNVIMNATCC